MATVSGGTSFALNFDEYDIGNIFDYDYATLGTTSARFYDNSSNYTLFQGKNLTYYSDGDPKSGVVTAVTFVESGSTVIKITGIKDIPATTVASYAYANNTLGILSIALAGADTIIGTARADVLYGFGGNDSIAGNNGADRIAGGNGNDTLNGGGGADRLDGGAGIDTLIGGADNDTYFVDNASDVIAESSSQGAVDRALASVSYALKAGVYVELLSTTSASSTAAISLTGNVLKQAITGNAGANVLNEGGAGAADRLAGLGGNDIYRIHNAGAVIIETASEGSADKVIASVGYKLGAGVHVEQMTTSGSSGTTSINLVGNEFAQTIVGNAGVNVLDGKGGGDRLQGGLGKDFFQFSSSLGASNADAIVDFTAVDDTIRLDNAVFTALTATGALAAGYFKNIAVAAMDANDRIIYNSDSGALYYDADGSGTAFSSIKFAALLGQPTITAADFVVI